MTDEITENGGANHAVQHATPSLSLLYILYIIEERKRVRCVIGGVSVQVHAWDPILCMHIPVGEPVSIDVSGLEKKIPVVRRGKRFLKGPVPWDWIVCAASLPGKALIVGLCLWRLKGATSDDSVWLGNTETEPFGIDRAAKSRALKVLERAQLVTVDRSDSRRLMITLLSGKL